MGQFVRASRRVARSGCGPQATHILCLAPDRVMAGEIVSGLAKACDCAMSVPQCMLAAGVLLLSLCIHSFLCIFRFCSCPRVRRPSQLLVRPSPFRSRGSGRELPPDTVICDQCHTQPSLPASSISPRSPGFCPSLPLPPHTQVEG